MFKKRITNLIVFLLCAILLLPASIGLQNVKADEGDLVALNRVDGKIYWSTIIPYENPQNNEKYFASGPILANDALLVVSSNGKLFSVSPYNGRIMGIADVEEGIETSPIMVNETLLLSNSSAELTAYK